VPSGIYSDAWSQPLRKVFLKRCRWDWLFGFENRDGIFDIHRSFKFNPIIVQKGGRTEAIRTAFMRRRLEDWERGEEFATPYTFEQVKRFSPKSRAILEIQSKRDLEILEKIYANSVLLGDDGPDGWGITYAREFDMTNDSKLFPPRPKWEEKGYRPDEYSRWLLGDWRPIEQLWAELGVEPLPEGQRHYAQPPYDRLLISRADIPAGIILSREVDAWIREDRITDTALPLYEGRMIGQFDFSQKGWVSGKGRSAVWRDVAWERKDVQPQYLMSDSDFQKAVFAEYSTTLAKDNRSDQSKNDQRRIREDGNCGAWWFVKRNRVAFMDVTSATNARTMVSSVVDGFPCGNSAPLLFSRACRESLVSTLNSLVYDYISRLRCSGLHLNWFVIEESPLPYPREIGQDLAQRALSMNCAWVGFAPSWLTHADDRMAWRRVWASTNSERHRIQVITDAIVAQHFGLTAGETRTVLHGCDWPLTALRDRISTGNLNPRGFWRVDKDKDPELRHTILTLIAFHDLEEKIRAAGGDRAKGIEAFLA